ncbi:MAG TPA: MaoC/PaaZ C-terminal domain-containing protein [Actinomycetota bacterium]
MGARIRLGDLSVGDEIPNLEKIVTREDVRAYADASGDQNPLHQDEAFAKSVGFPGIIAHGMFSMAHLVKALTDWLGDPAALRSITVQFRQVVYMGETLVAGGTVDAIDTDAGTATLAVWAAVERDGKRLMAIKNGRAEVHLS